MNFQEKGPCTCNPKPSKSATFDNFERVHMEDSRGIWCGWKSKNNDLIPGVLIDPSTAEREALQKEATKYRESIKEDARRQEQLDAVRSKRKAGESLTMEDIQSVIDALL